MTDCTRRELVAGLAGSLVLGALPRRGTADARGAAGPLDAALLEALGSSGLIYVSPLRTDGSESRCHGEVWFLWLDGGAHVVVSRDSWKARATYRGLDRARIWVGDLGVIRKARSKLPTAPRFDARARSVRDPGVIRAALEAYGRKYPAEWGKWKPRFEKGLADGSRLLLRYDPV